MKPDGGVPRWRPRRARRRLRNFRQRAQWRGALHALPPRARLLVPDAALVPAGAVVYAQVIEMRHAEVACGPDPLVSDSDLRYRESRAMAFIPVWPPSIDKRRLQMATLGASGGGVSTLRIRERHPRDASPGDVRARRARGRPRDVQRRRVLVRASSGQPAKPQPCVAAAGQGADVATGGTVRGGVRSATGRPTPARRQTRHVRRIVRGERRDVSEGGETHGGTAVRPDVGRGPRARGKGARALARAVAQSPLEFPASNRCTAVKRRGRATRGLWIGRLRGADLCARMMG